MSGRIFYSSLMTETNSFSNIPTSLESFAEGAILRGEKIFLGEDGNPLPGFEEILATAQSKGFSLVGGLSASAEPGAPTQHRDYVVLRDEILESLAAARPVSAVLLALHGAMMSTECADCEGDILQRIRSLVGPATPIAAVLDPHAHLTEQMVSNADFIVFMKEYPHTDGIERTREALDVIFRLLGQELKLTAAVADCELLGFFPTQSAPMREFVDRMSQMEESPDVVSVSFIHGFPWGDSPDLGAKVLVYTNNDVTQAHAIAAELAKHIWSIKDQTMFATISVSEAIRKLQIKRSAPVIFADISDNAGGGAPSDSTFILEALLEAGITNVALGLLFDPEAVRYCHQVGVDGRLTLRIGGKTSSFSGSPIDLDVMVRAVHCSAEMNVLDLAWFPLGNTAWVQGKGIDIVLVSRRIQTYSPHGFTHLGLDLAGKDAVFVKSTNHFRATFEGIASEIFYVNTPGAINFNLAKIPYRVFDKHYYPRCPGKR